MKNKIISIKDVSMVYTNPEGEKFHALKSINLDIYEGEYVAILGTSGSGKTTLSNVIGMLNGAYTGSYIFDDIKGHKLSERQRCQIRGDKFGFIFQDYVLLDYLTALENVALALHYSPISKKKILELAEAKLRSVGMGDKLHHRPYQLSGGQKQRVSIARALVKNPKVIIADEPTGALDHNSRVEVLSLLQELNQQGVTIITVTHSLEDSQAAKRIIKVEKGQLASDQVQRYRERFFGKLVNFSDPQQVLIRKMMILEHVNLNYGIQEKEDFISIPEEECDSEVKFKLLNQLKPEWLADNEVRTRLENWFETSEEMIQLQIAGAALKASVSNADVSKMVQSIGHFFELSWKEETCMFFFQNLKNIPVKALKSVIQFEQFFNHHSDKVRATAIQFFSMPDLMTENDFQKYLPLVLSDKDSRVRSNMLDYLYKLKNFDFQQLQDYQFELDESSRVKAIWAEMLISLHRKEEAMEILETMIFSRDLSCVLAGVWVLAKEPEFNMVQFLSDKIDENPSLLGFIDDILKTYDRVKKDLMNWRQVKEDTFNSEDKAA